MADFEGSSLFQPGIPIKDQVYKMYEPGFFLQLKPVEGALASVRALMRMGYDVHILSRPIAESPQSYTEKAQWVGMWFPDLINKLNLTQNKEFFKGDYLIDDDSELWQAKWEATGGKFVHFDYCEKDDYSKAPNFIVWANIVDFFRTELETK